MSKDLQKTRSTNPQIQEFLGNVEEKMPEWLKEKEEELEEALQEMEEHIWDKIEEMEQMPSIQQQNLDLNEIINKAIKEMGSPAKIANEYKKRGTPKYYITEELFPYYKQTLEALFGFSLIIIILEKALSLEITAGKLFVGIITGIFTSIPIVFTISSLIWIGLSMQGYLPEDLGIKEEKTMKNGIETTKRTYNIGKLDNNKEKEPIKPLEYAFGGIFTLVFGILLIYQPFESLNNLFNLEFMNYLRYAGYISIIEACIYFGRTFVGKRNVFGHQALVSGFIATQICNIILLHWLINNPNWLEWNIFTMPLVVLQIILVLSYLGLFGKINDLINVYSSSFEELLANMYGLWVDKEFHLQSIDLKLLL